MGHFILRWRCHCSCHHQALEQHGIKIKWSDVLFFLFLANCAWGERWHQGSQGKFLRNQFQPWWCGCSVAWRSFFSCNLKLINLFWIYQDPMCLDRLLADSMGLIFIEESNVFLFWSWCIWVIFISTCDVPDWSDTQIHSTTHDVEGCNMKMYPVNFFL